MLPENLFNYHFANREDFVQAESRLIGFLPELLECPRTPLSHDIYIFHVFIFNKDD